MSNFNSVPPTQTNALARGGENAGVSSRDSSGVGAIANQTLARVLVSQVTPTVVTLTNPQNKQAIQVSASIFSDKTSGATKLAVTSGQAFDLLQLANKPNTYLLIAANTGSSSTTSQASNQATQAAIANKLPSALLSNNVNINDNQINSLLTKAASLGNITISGTSTAALQGSIVGISNASGLTQLSIKFQVAGSNLGAQQAQITLSTAQASAFKLGDQVQINADLSGKSPKILSINNLSTNSTTVLTASQGQLNKGVLPTALLNTSLLEAIATKAGAVQAAPTGANQSIASPNKLLIPLNQNLLALLPKSLQESFQNLSKQAVSELANSINNGKDNAVAARGESAGSKSLFLSIEAGKTKGSLSISVLGNLRPQRFELSAAQAQSLLLKSSSSAALSGVAQSSDSPLERAPVNARNIVIPTKADLIAKNALFNQRVNNFAAASMARANPTSVPDDIPKASNTQSVPQFESNKLLQKLVQTLIQKGQINPSSADPSAKVLNPVIEQIIKQIAHLQGSVDANADVKTKEALSTPNANPSQNKPLSSVDIKAIAKALDFGVLKNSLQELNKQSLVLSGSQSQSIASINSQLNAVLTNSAELDQLSPETQQLLKSIKEQLPKTDSNVPNLDSRTIQTLLASPLNPPPISALASISQGGFLSGLVTLLQVSLASKLQRQSNKQASKLQDQIPDIVKNIIPTISNVQSARMMQDFRQFDAKHNLSAEVAKLLANHQHSKITSAESSLQGQDQLYYSLPNLLNKDADDLELLIKRESQEKKNTANEESVSSWYLTMKLDVGEHGKILAKTQLTENQIKLQLYTSTETLKNKALNMLPYLQKRLAQLGIDLIERSCAIGKVPTQLKPEHYHLFETKV
ncbi:flagellar hook-length control protein FliK [Glaciecola sp. MH2013]|uniref:flagellar hook-length control protein FliK n=1 Tax=Glaciecola sp. MH2013 TaxID=2785524 RepID=UPI00189F3EB1|nr:flagellar hook-length control protein FliK [Glaciecola sp. MH2013]MBF7072203.1 flagellar hook-length control protein FliK [Glaciecola sp. MH2013]